ncbi:MAG: UDP-3-O-(3-hydroxymyristoyl)glucosamine N-acyltransferase [Pyrinomonadaceae bacterium]|nr:UDP-3-O-(3-hydroxymyristoyl)glucosamine N-acyltransferase [Pyrinomonadaceae bacterium]MCX7640683.1 UDP-3-O-(3-hydroxymyristoyl)glucosamine N-acyltransferase [Pyrinomonadaceae bacterium]MDW8305367.1 UDP-3-O-(3-hydroxymyristoyl)glucosamine N-acyltransferase [Acidobacteriota bacterium]
MKAREIAALFKGEVIGDPETEVFHIASLDTAKKGDIAFIESESKLRAQTEASCLIVPKNFSSPVNSTIIKVENPKLTFAKLAALLNKPEFPEKISKTAIISTSAKVEASFVGEFVVVGENSKIGQKTIVLDGVKVGKNVSIGENCKIYSNVVIYDNVTIGNNCIIHSGAVIGADGFGFVRDKTGYVKFPQVGTVVIEDDVEIGANTCIDRGALDETRIGAGTKIDNLVQVGHNVRIGKRVIIAAQTGISGSVVIEDDCVIGGQVGIGDHVTLQSGATIGSQAGVLPGKIVRKGVWWGTPIQPLNEYKRLHAHFKSLISFKERLKNLEKLVNEILSRLDKT